MSFTAMQDPSGEQPAEPSNLESLLLGELTHRTVNDFGAAAAAVYLAKRSATDSRSTELLDILAHRFVALGTIQRLLLSPGYGKSWDLTDRLEQLCQAMTSARFAEAGVALHLHSDDVTVESGRGWRILMIVAELLVNAARHAFDGKGGVVNVCLRQRGSVMMLKVRDNGRGHAGGGTASRGYGSSVVDLLVAEIGGRVSIATSAAGTSIEIIAPLSTPPKIAHPKKVQSFRVDAAPAGAFAL